MYYMKYFLHTVVIKLKKNVCAIGQIYESRKSEQQKINRVKVSKEAAWKQLFPEWFTFLCCH